MEITGKIIAVLEERSGIAARTGNSWHCGQYVLETIEQYPKKMLFEVFGEDKIKSMNIQAGEELTVSFDIDAREYNGRWYNQIRAWKVDRPESTTTTDDSTPADDLTPFPPMQDGGDIPVDNGVLPF